MLFADTPTLGLMIGLPIGIILFLICSGFATWVLMESKNRGYVNREVRGIGISLVAIAFVVAVSTLIAMWPLKHDYHYWVPKGGTVEKVSKRLVPAGDNGMQEKIVMVIDGHPYGVLDTRAALVEVGDRVDIRCKKSFDWGSPNHGWDCKWAGVE